MNLEIDIFKKDVAGEEITPETKDYNLIVEEINRTQLLVKKLNENVNEKRKKKIFSQILDKPYPENLWFLTPMSIDFGKQLEIGKNVFINFNATFLDRGKIVIGDNTMIGPNCSLYTTNHPLDPTQRRNNISKKIILEENVWLGGNVVVLPGVTIGMNSIIGAGSVVTKDVPPNSIAAGNPAKVIKKL